MEKTPINPEDIQPNDLIRIEYPEGYQYERRSATEYRAERFGERKWTSPGCKHFLLERPEPPFEPYWGMVIGKPNSIADRGVYLPSRKWDAIPWLAYNGEEDQTEWTENSWARARLAEGWVVIEKPEDVK